MVAADSTMIRHQLNQLLNWLRPCNDSISKSTPLLAMTKHAPLSMPLAELYATASASTVDREFGI
jgi:hypothetical protein